MTVGELFEANRKDKGRRVSLWHAEVAGWLHTAGKVCERFFRYHAAPPRDRMYNHCTIAGFLAQALERWPSEMAAKYGAEFIRSTTETMKEILPHRWLNEAKIDLPGLGTSTTAAMIDLQDAGWQVENKYPVEYFVPKEADRRMPRLLTLSHDRASKGEKEGSQSFLPKGGAVFRSSVFGKEEEQERAKLDSPGEYRERWLRLGADVSAREARLSCIEDRQQLLVDVCEAFRGVIADANLTINDVTVADMAVGAAAFLKAAITRVSLEAPDWRRLHDAGYERQEFRFRTMRVAIDGTAYFGRVERIPDLLIRRQLIDRLLNNVKQALEEEVWLMNEIYRDHTGSCFLAPAFTAAALQREFDQTVERAVVTAFRRPVKILVEGRTTEEADAGYELTPTVLFSAADRNGQTLGAVLGERVDGLEADTEAVKRWWRGRQTAICVACHLRPIGDRHGSDAERKAYERKVCLTCEQRREDRSSAWCTEALAGKRGESRPIPTTIWVNEVADQNGRVALIGARFRLDRWLSGDYVENSLKVSRGGGTSTERKKASFARIRRVWETCQTFWGDWMEEDLPPALTDRRRRYHLRLRTSNMRLYHSYELRKGSLRVSCVCAGREQGRFDFVTADNLDRVQVLSGERDKVAWEVAFREPGWRIREENSEETIGAAIEGVELLEAPDAALPIIRIQQEPQLLMILVPAKAALQIADSLRKRYEVEMASVRNRLALDIGITYAPAATPIAALLDATRRMVECEVRDEPWTVEAVDELAGKAAIRFTNGVEWEIPTKIGGGDKEDKYYPYFELDGSGEWVHVLSLRPGTVVRVEPSRFDFEYLETAGMRHEILYDANGRRAVGGHTRPHPIESIPELIETWDLLKAELHGTQLQGLWGLLEGKRRDWSDDGVWRGFAEQAFLAAKWRHKPAEEQLQKLTAQAVSGIFPDTLELHLKIMKERAEAKGHEQSAA